MKVTASLSLGSVPNLGAHVAKLTLTTDQVRGGKLHHMLKLDVSGSMSSVIDDVRDDAAGFVAELSDDEFVSVIIFSGHGQAKLIAGPTRCDAAGRKLVIAAIKSGVKILGTTVFSEPLALTLETAKRLAGNDLIHSSTLFTDGCAVPTRWSATEERQKALKEAAALGAFGAVLNTIGYGNWYDPKFLHALGEAAGGEGMERHVSEIEGFAPIVASIRETLMKTAFVDMELTIAGAGSVGAILSVTPQVRQAGTAGLVHLRGLYEGTAELYVELPKKTDKVTVSAKIGGKAVTLDVVSEKFGDVDAANFVRAKAAYAASTGDTGSAAELFAQTGDDGLADLVGNAYSDREQREVGDLARRFFVDRKFIGAGLKPVGPSHNVLNILRSLIEDEGNVVYLAKDSYKRGGLATRDPRVIENPLGRSLQVMGYMSQEDRFNFSVLTLKDVKVLPEDGNGSPVDMKIWRSYNIIRDGNLVTPKLEARVTESTFNELRAAGCINGGEKYRDTKVYPLDFAGIKLVSPNWAQPANLGLVQLLREEAALMAEQKALNAKKKALAAASGIIPADSEAGIYREKATTVADAVLEYYDAPSMYIELYGHKAPEADVSRYATYEEVNARVKAVRQRLVTVRFIIRAMTFAMHVTKSRAIAWGPVTAMPRTKTGKEQQLANFGGVELRKVFWTEQVVCS